MLTSLLPNTNVSIMSSNAKARVYALEYTAELTNLIPPTVNYESRGNVVIIGPYSEIQKAVKPLSMMHSVTLLVTDHAATDHSTPDVSTTLIPNKDTATYYASFIEVNGFLGTFDVKVVSSSTGIIPLSLSKVAINQAYFDVVLDMSNLGYMREEVPVPGYYPVGRGFNLEQALDEIPTLIGLFDKPKYFRFDRDLCAHSARGLKGCERCVLSCPAGALSSNGNEQTGYNIEINPHLCQGVGTCATACPTGAISYALPEPQQTQKLIERLLNHYHQQDGDNAVILITSERHEEATKMALELLPDNVLPIMVEELPSVGIDTWFAALVNGATQILFAASHHMPPTILRILNNEVAIAQSLLEQLGLERSHIDILYLESLEEEFIDLPLPSLGLSLSKLEGDKRQRLFYALDALAERYPPTASVQPLMIENAPYGAVNCIKEQCTLCMGCVAVCPTKALHNDSNTPQLNFIEQDCVQCGLCVKACPEKALSLIPQFNWNKLVRTQALTLNQDVAAECLRCHQPFAPQSMITMLQNKLQGHSLFGNQTALNRIAMCENCRVIDAFEKIEQDPLQQLKY